MKRVFGLTGAILLATWTGQSLAATAPSPGMRVVTAADQANSLTGGIQEAIDSLPPEGGAVYVPAGTYLLHRPVILKPSVKLIGAGKATVLKKSPGFKLLLAEDAKRNQDYVVLQDVSPLKPGMVLAIGDKKHGADIWGGMFFVTKIEGNRIFIKHILGGGGLRSDLAVGEAACAMNLFMVILPARDCIIQDLDIDANGAEQVVEEVIKYGWSYGMLWCGIYPANEIKVQRCLIHHAGIGIHINGRDVEISDSEIYGNWADGIHCGGGPGSFIINNRIYDNRAGGISFCYGNKGLIITGNQIYDNEEGIKALGINDPKIDTIADQITIVSNNVIYLNQLAGIASGQGWIGPQDFIFTDNIVKDNWQGGRRGALPHDVPGGMMLYNAQRCVVTGNRCLDDQDMLVSKLAKPVEVGESTITVAGSPFWQGSRITISEGENAEVQQVAKKERDQLTLAGKLARSYQAGATVIGRKTQPWGIYVGGPDARGNVVMNNACDGNTVGGVVWDGSDTLVSANLGRTIMIDPNKMAEESIYPARRTAVIPNPGFEEDTGWHGGTYDTPGYAGQRAIKLSKAEEKGVADSISDPVPLKPNTRYRLSAWVKSNARKGDRLVLPYLFLYTNQQVGGQTSPFRVLNQPISYDPMAGIEPMTWVRVVTEGFSEGIPKEARVYCRLANATGDAWVDDVSLEELEEAPVTVK